jgi:hypothetical protein
MAAVVLADERGRSPLTAELRQGALSQDRAATTPSPNMILRENY